MSPLLVFTVTLACVWGATSQSCSNPAGEESHCVVIFECGPMRELLLSKTISKENRQLLKSSHCGFNGTSPKVCCPVSALPPKGADDEANVVPADAHRQRRRRGVPGTLGGGGRAGGDLFNKQ